MSIYSNYSKATGIIRRLDKLGRVVLPREYRKLHKIRVGDPMELICHDNGDIVVRKFDLASQLFTIGSPIVDELFSTVGHSILLCSPSKVLYTAGSKGVAVGAKIDSKTQDMISERKCFSGTAKDLGFDFDGFATLCTVFGDDLFGGLVIISDKEVTEADSKIIKMVARIIGSSMQKF